VVQAKKSKKSKKSKVRNFGMGKASQKLLKDAGERKDQRTPRCDQTQPLKLCESIGQLIQAMPEFESETFKAVMKVFLNDSGKGWVNDLPETLPLLPKDGSAICDCLKFIKFLSTNCHIWMNLGGRSRFDADVHREATESLFQQLFLAVAKYFFWGKTWSTERSCELIDCMSSCLRNIEAFCTELLLEDPFSNFLECISESLCSNNIINEPFMLQMLEAPECAARDKVVREAALNVAKNFREHSMEITACVCNDLPREKGVKTLLKLSQLLRNVAKRFNEEDFDQQMQVDFDIDLNVIDLDLNLIDQALLDVLHAISIRKVGTKETPDQLQALKIRLEVEKGRQQVIEIVKEIKSVRDCKMSIIMPVEHRIFRNTH
jgi:hypothetical protein